MKLGQLMVHIKINFFLQSYAENKSERLVPDLFLFFDKA